MVLLRYFGKEKTGAPAIPAPLSKQDVQALRAFLDSTVTNMTKKFLTWPNVHRGEGPSPRVFVSAISDEWMTVPHLALFALLAEFSCVVFDNSTCPADVDKNLTFCTDEHGLPCDPKLVPWDKAVGLMTNE